MKDVKTTIARGAVLFFPGWNFSRREFAPPVHECWDLTRLSVPVTHRQKAIHVATSSFMTMDYSLLLYSLWVPVILAVEGKCKSSLLQGYSVSKLLLYGHQLAIPFMNSTECVITKICTYLKLVIYRPLRLFWLENFAFDENLNSLGAI